LLRLISEHQDELPEGWPQPRGEVASSKGTTEQTVTSPLERQCSVLPPLCGSGQIAHVLDPFHPATARTTTGSSSRRCRSPRFPPEGSTPCR
jgi:hypothetical protein